MNIYEMDLRQYDPAIARWVVQDPVIHHEFSPYSAFDNNPVFWSDSSGADSVTDWLGRGKYDPNGLYIIPSDRVGGDIELASFYTYDAGGKENSGTGSGNGPDKKSGGGVSKLWNRFKSWLRGEPKYTSVTILVGPIEGDGYEEGIPCVECHHTTMVPNGEKMGDLAGGTGALIINGISTFNMGSAEIEGLYKQINVNDLPGFTGPGQNLTQKITEALTKLASLNEDQNIRSWVLGKEKDPYVHHTYKKFKIMPSPYINNKNYIIPDRKDTIIRQSQIQKVDKASIYDSLRLLPLLNKPN